MKYSLRTCKCDTCKCDRTFNKCNTDIKKELFRSYCTSGHPTLKTCYCCNLLIYYSGREYYLGTHFWGLHEKRATRVECKNKSLPHRLAWLNTKDRMVESHCISALFPQESGLISQSIIVVDSQKPCAIHTPMP